MLAATALGWLGALLITAPVSAVVFFAARLGGASTDACSEVASTGQSRSRSASTCRSPLRRASRSRRAGERSRLAFSRARPRSARRREPCSRCSPSRSSKHHSRIFLTCSRRSRKSPSRWRSLRSRYNGEPLAEAELAAVRAALAVWVDALDAAARHANLPLLELATAQKPAIADVGPSGARRTREGVPSVSRVIRRHHRCNLVGCLRCLRSCCLWVWIRSRSRSCSALPVSRLVSGSASA